MERAPESAIRFDLASRDGLVLSKGRKSLKALFSPWHLSPFLLIRMTQNLFAGDVVMCSHSVLLVVGTEHGSTTHVVRCAKSQSTCSPPVLVAIGGGQETASFSVSQLSCTPPTYPPPPPHLTSLTPASTTSPSQRQPIQNQMPCILSCMTAVALECEEEVQH